MDKDLLKKSYRIKHKIIFYFVSIFCILWFVYAPSIGIPFIHHDDYRFWHPFDDLKFLESYYISLGRYAASLLLLVYDIYVDNIDQLSHLRILTLVPLGISIFLVIQILTRCGMNLSDSFFLAIIPMLNPSVQVPTLWLMTSAALYALPFALLAGYILLDRVIDKNPINLSTYGIVVLLLTLSNITYPASSTFFFAPIIVLLCTPGKSGRFLIKNSFNWLLIFFSTMGVYFLFHKFFLLGWLLSNGFPEPWPQDKFSLTNNLLSGFGKLLNEVIPYAANIFGPYTNSTIASIVGSFFLLSLVVICVSRVPDLDAQSPKQRISVNWAALICLTVIFIAINFHTILPENSNVYLRTVAMTSWFFAITILFALQRSTLFFGHLGISFFRLTSITGLLVMATLSQSNMLAHARNLNLEAMYFVSQVNLKSKEFPEANTIFVIPVLGKRERIYTGHSYGVPYEYHVTSRHSEWVSYLNAFGPKHLLSRDKLPACSVRFNRDIDCNGKNFEVYDVRPEDNKTMDDFIQKDRRRNMIIDLQNLSYINR